jgi:hypothetical protein
VLLGLGCACVLRGVIPAQTNPPCRRPVLADGLFPSLSGWCETPRGSMGVLTGAGSEILVYVSTPPDKQAGRFTPASETDPPDRHNLSHLT